MLLLYVCFCVFLFFLGVGWCFFLNIILLFLVFFVCRFFVIWYLVLIGLNVLLFLGVFSIWFVVDKMLNGNLFVFVDRFCLVWCFFLLNRMLFCWLVLGLGFVVVLLFNRLFFVNWLFLVFKFLVGSGLLFSVLFLLMGLNFFSGCLLFSGDR